VDAAALCIQQEDGVPLPDAQVQVPVVCEKHLLVQPLGSLGRAGSGQQVAGHLDWPWGPWWWGHRRLMSIIGCRCGVVLLLIRRHAAAAAAAAKKTDQRYCWCCKEN
jgi:hypothetical protein